MSFHRTCISSHHIAPSCLECTCKTSSVLSIVKDIHPPQHVGLCNFFETYPKVIEEMLIALIKLHHLLGVINKVDRLSNLLKHVMAHQTKKNWRTDKMVLLQIHVKTRFIHYSHQELNSDMHPNFIFCYLFPKLEQTSFRFSYTFLNFSSIFTISVSVLVLWTILSIISFFKNYIIFLWKSDKG